MLVEQEAFIPNSNNLQLIENVAVHVIQYDSKFNDWVGKYVKGQKHRLAFDLDMIQKYLNKESEILEVGSSPLLLTGSLKNLGYKIQGIDINPERFASAITSLKLDVKKCDIEQEPLPIKNECFDGVIFNEMFEHLRINLIFTMREVYRVTKPGGLLLLSTPNLRSYRGIVNFLFKNKSYSLSHSIYDEYDKLNKLGHMGHMREYTTRDVMDFLEKIGFQTQVIIYRGKYYKKTEQILVMLLPSLRPFFTIIARKHNF